MAEEIAPGSETKELSIKEEYQLWRKNCRYMYEFVSETALTWPSLTIQWLPNHTTQDGVINTSLLLGTHTSGNDTNYLKVAETQISADGTATANSRIKITKKFENKQEICRARYMPQDTNIVGTINGSGQVNLYKLDSEDKSSYHHFSPHSENGYGLSWNPLEKGLLLTAADDGLACVTDVLGSYKTTVFKSSTNTDIVNDAKWHFFDKNIFATVSEDEYAYIFDTRTTEPVAKYHAEGSKGINSLAFSPFSRNLLAIGSTNSNISLLDTRKLDNRNGTAGLLHTMMGHTDGITSMEFSPHKDGILASGSQDRRLILWDLTKIGEEQQQEDAEDGCPELFMMHAGHTAGVTDLSWCPFREWTIGSVADDNIVHLWEVSKSLINDPSNEEVDPSILE